MQKEEKPLSTSPKEPWLEGWIPMTYKQGFKVGFVLAIILQAGILNIPISTLRFVVILFLAAGVVTSTNEAFSRSALINPQWDGLISGFCTFAALIDLIFYQFSVFH